jgi:DNA-directed RNA polymerase subunit beta
MDLSFTQKKSIRKNFGKLIEDLAIPNLIEVQKNSYNEFLSSTSIYEDNDELTKGIQKTFQSIFPIEDGSEKSTLEYISYKLEKPKFDVLECKQRSLTYASSIKANLRLVVYDIDPDTNTKQILSAKEQEVFIGTYP